MESQCSTAVVPLVVAPKVEGIQLGARVAGIRAVVLIEFGVSTATRS